METIVIESMDQLQDIDDFFSFAEGIYQNDDVWASESKDMFIGSLQESIAGADRPGTRRIWPVLVRDDVGVKARGAAIFDPASKDSNGDPLGWIGYFEAPEFSTEAVGKLISKLESLLKSAGAKKVLALKCGELLLGIQISGFELPQTVFTPHNPPYYVDYFKDRCYEERIKLKTFLFESETVKFFSKEAPGINVREFDREHLDREVELFNKLNNHIFGNNWGRIPRSVEEDRHLIESFLPWIIDDFMLYAENEQGEVVGFLVCLPDLYQMKTEGKIDRARILTIGVMPGQKRKGIGTAMVSKLVENLQDKDYRSLEASWVMEDNKEPQELAAQFNAFPGREFVLLTKEL